VIGLWDARSGARMKRDGLDATVWISYGKVHLAYGEVKKKGKAPAYLGFKVCLGE
jgi:hypothetical protein